jgi:hypothetical protein
LLNKRHLVLLYFLDVLTITMCTNITIILEFYALNVLMFIFNILYPNSIKEFHFVNNNVRDWTKILEPYALNVLMFIFNILYPNSTIKESHYVNNNVKDWIKILKSCALTVLMFIFNILYPNSTKFPHFVNNNVRN